MSNITGFYTATHLRYVPKAEVELVSYGLDDLEFRNAKLCYCLEALHKYQCKLMPL